jgi:hypothetical protein
LDFFQGFATTSSKQVLRYRALNMDQETTLSASWREVNQKGRTKEEARLDSRD